MALHVDKLHTLLKFAASRQLPLVVVGAERDADWGTYGGAVTEDFSPKFVRVANLSTTEIEGLLDLLERHDCLGLLKERPRQDQVKAFTERADRQLLVALHELTQGKPFEEILFAEHQSIHPEQARQLYLDMPGEPDHRIAAAHQKAVSGMCQGVRIVRGRGVVEELQHSLVAAVAVVEEPPAVATRRVDRLQNREITRGNERAHWNRLGPCLGR